MASFNYIPTTVTSDCFGDFVAYEAIKRVQYRDMAKLHNTYNEMMQKYHYVQYLKYIVRAENNKEDVQDYEDMWSDIKDEVGL